MAGDKFKDGFPIAVDFVSGEQPTDIKLDGFAEQTKNALDMLESAVGDIWNQSKALGTDPLSNRDLHISNIGRVLGPASMLSPQILDGIQITDFTYAVPVGVKEFILPHRPMIGLPLTDSTIDWDGSARFTSEKASEDLLAATGDYFIDYLTGRIFTYTLTQAGDTATYNYSSVGDSFSNASFNVIPDPRQTTKRCDVTDVAGDLTVTLPYIKYDQDGILLTDGTDPNYSDSGSTQNIQRALLPSFLSALSIGDVIPAGYVFLYDNDPTIDAVVEGATLRYLSQTQFIVKNVFLEEGSARYSVITIGSPLSELMYELRKRYRIHTHDGSNGDERIAHANLIDNIYKGGDTWGAADAPFTELGYVPSEVAQNSHPMYLMRSGYKTGIDSNNSDNVMRGEIMMGSVSPVGNNFTNLDDKSRSIFFGSESGPRLRYNNEARYDGLQLLNKSFSSDNNVNAGCDITHDGANIGYFGFGTAPSANHITFNEAHSVSKRFEFKEGGSAAVSDISAGSVISQEGKLYMGDKLGSGNTYLHATPLGTTFEMYANDSIHGSFLKVGKIRLYSNVIYFTDDGDKEYISYNDSNDTFTFVADSSISASTIESGNLRTTNAMIEMGDSNNRIYRSGNRFYFDYAGNYSGSRLLTGYVFFGVPGSSHYEWLDYERVDDLTNGGHTTLHKHKYYRYFGTFPSIYRASGDFATKTVGPYGAEIIGVAIRGWDVNGNFGNNSQQLHRDGNRVCWGVEASTGNEDWDDTGYIRISITYRSSSSYYTH